MRMVTEALGKLWGQQAVLINQPGAGGALAARTVAEAQPDGHTLFLALASAFVVLPETQRNLSFNVNDFVPVGFVGEAPMAIAVSPTLPVSNISELVALSKTQSGGLNAAVAFRGGMPHLATELFASRSGAALSSVHYPSSAQSLSDVVSGRVQVIVEGLGGPVGSGQVWSIIRTWAGRSASSGLKRMSMPASRQAAKIGQALLDIGAREHGAQVGVHAPSARAACSGAGSRRSWARLSLVFLLRGGEAKPLDHWR
jgi:hypothetical protein